MRRNSKVMLLASSVGVASLALGGVARAGVTVDGTLNGSEGYALEATQTINTGFGDSTVGDGTSNGGSELDAAYGVISGGNLNLFLSGNFESNGNHVNVFVSDGRPGQSVLSVPATGSMQAMNGSVFSPGFQATYAIDVNEYAGTDYVEDYQLTAPGVLTGGYNGSFAVPGGIGTGQPGATAALIGWNDTNAAGVNGVSGTAANPAAADAVATGMELSIPLSVLGNTSGPIMVLADINGGGDGYLSNQFLPGLPVGTGNVGGGGSFTGPSSGAFNFSNTPGEFFTVSVPEPTSIGLIGGAVMMLFARRRKA